MKPATSILAAAAVLLTGCAMGPKYNRPKPPVPSGWKADADVASAAPEAASLKWQEFFSDAKLREVIGLALANNRDLRMSALNVERVQQLYRIQRSGQYPGVNVSRTADLYRMPRKMSPVGEAYTAEQYGLNVGAASWELDLFGRIRSLKAAALEQYLASEQARSAAQISLVAAVANTYLALAADRENLKIAQATFDSQKASYDLIKRSRDAGIASDLDLRQAESQVEVARADIARYTGLAEVDVNALELLAGAPVPASLLPSELGTASALKELSPGLPSSVLLRRPDILAAEHQLKAAYANIGAARAAFFPRISLTAATGLMSGDITQLYKAGSGTWNFAPQAALPIFDAGARRANLKVAEVDRDSAIAGYERAIQAAFREVNDSLALRTQLMEEQRAQEALVASLAETHRLSEARYKAGIDSYLSVLVAQRSLYAAEQGLVGLRLARLSNLVTLYKVLGGGA
ncbi:MAG: efflux transporter outer membrane subunit [Acidobacteriota bacterium]